MPLISKNNFQMNFSKVQRGLQISWNLDEHVIKWFWHWLTTCYILNVLEVAQDQIKMEQVLRFMAYFSGIVQKMINRWKFKVYYLQCSETFKLPYLIWSSYAVYYNLQERFQSCYQEINRWTYLSRKYLKLNIT